MKLNDTHTRYIMRSSDDSASSACLAPSPPSSRRFAAVSREPSESDANDDDDGDGDGDGDGVTLAVSSGVVRTACRARSSVAGLTVRAFVSVPGPEFESDPEPIVVVVVFFVFVVDVDEDDVVFPATGAGSPRRNASFGTSRVRSVLASFPSGVSSSDVSSGNGSPQCSFL